MNTRREAVRVKLTQERIHYILIWVWGLQFVGALVCLVLAIYFGFDPTTYFLLSVGYVSLCSIYANLATHWGAWEAARAEAAAERSNEDALS